MVNDYIRQWFLIKEKLFCRHSNVLKSMKKVKVLSRLAVESLMAVMWANIEMEKP